MSGLSKKEQNKLARKNSSATNINSSSNDLEPIGTVLFCAQNRPEFTRGGTINP
jgi:hypothetical protein